jgi:CheY-like chemotaxis protein
MAAEAPALCGSVTERAQHERERRILVVEDNADAAEILRALLATCGYRVSVARTAQEGLECARRVPPDVVLCDIGLPDSTGYVVGAVLRQSSHTRHARLIALTAHGEPQDRRRALAAGFDQHLVKPVNPKDLLLELET